jgi:TatD DNase family protein
MLTDTHAHLFFSKPVLHNPDLSDQFSFENDLEEVLKKSKEAGITQIVNVGVDANTSKIALEQLAAPIFERSRITFYSSIGIHPEEAFRFAPLTQGHGLNLTEEVIKLEEIYRSNPEKVVAVGEVGLDFAYFTRVGYLPEDLTVDQAKDLQRQLFIAQIELAKKLNLPLLIHVRDDRSENPENSVCWNEAIDLSKTHFGIYHCYSGMRETTQKILTETNFLISFAGNITYPRNEYLREAVRIVPLDRIVLETDCPFLPPQSIRGQRNEPNSVKEIAQLIAEIKDITIEKVARETTENFLRLIQS